MARPAPRWSRARRAVADRLGQEPTETTLESRCGGGYSSFAVVGGKVYTQDKQGGNERVICLDAESGRLVWEHVYPADYSGLRMGYAQGPRATPTIDGNRLYAVGAVGKFACLELPAAGGQPRLLWEHDLLDEFGAALPGWGVACSPLVDGELVIVQPGGRDGSVVAFDKVSGELRWKAGSNPGGYSSPVATTLNGLRVIYAFAGDALLCIRADDGELLDQYTWTTQHRANIATPVVHDQWVFISSGYNKGCALLRTEVTGDRARLREVYARSNRVMRNHHSSCVFKDWRPLRLRRWSTPLRRLQGRGCDRGLGIEGPEERQSDPGGESPHCAHGGGGPGTGRGEARRVSSHRERSLGAQPIGDLGATGSRGRSALSSRWREGGLLRRAVTRTLVLNERPDGVNGGRDGGVCVHSHRFFGPVSTER